MALQADRHSVVKNVVGIIASFHILQKRVQTLVSVIELRPKRISQHIAIGIIDIATLVMLSGIWSMGIARVDVGAGVQVAVKILQPLQASGVVFRILPV